MIETAAYIADLNTSNPSEGSLVAEGAGHLTLIKAAVRNTLPNLNAQVTATPAELNNPILATARPTSGASIPYYTNPTQAGTLPITEYGKSLLLLQDVNALKGAINLDVYTLKAGDTMTGALTVPRLNVVDGNFSGLSLRSYNGNPALYFDATSAIVFDVSGKSINFFVDGVLVGLLNKSGDILAKNNVRGGVL